MAKYIMFLGCNIPARLVQYNDASTAVLQRAGVEIVNTRCFNFPIIAPYYDNRGEGEQVDARCFNCCGYPLRNSDYKAYLLSAVRNLAVAEKEGVDMLVLCKCCYGSLKKAEYIMKEDSDLKAEINGYLVRSGLKYEGKIRVKHLLSVLYHDVGIDTLKQKISRPYDKKLGIAVHYGCHILRPSKVTQFDDPVSPTLFDELVEITGAKSVELTTRLECCGAPLRGINDRLSGEMARRKVTDSIQAGAHYLCTACPFSHLQFNRVQKTILSEDKDGEYIPPILYPQLLGLSMGIHAKTLGFHRNQFDISGIKSFL
ncbi:CoB--CoM heterodisulfide reductase iron-sulfur subunit B family protein [Desulfococcaceae bacterium HSG8]|nr:CoB--CoM heterodisulfide reductase iron-sulfur subunit B family protein [Desulfococcaceae bacterium HSG8]